jgi:hypothetical protein
MLAEKFSCVAKPTRTCMLVTATGLPFVSSSFAKYLANMFEKEVNIRAGTTKLRHAVVTHIMSLPESESLKLRKSLAILMRHSLKHQQGPNARVQARTEHGKC